MKETNMLVLCFCTYLISCVQPESPSSINKKGNVQDFTKANSITFAITFKSKGKVYFDYLDTMYRNAVIPFINFSDKDTILYRNVPINNTTVYTYTENKHNNLFQASYIAEANDTLRFEYNNDNLLSTGLNSKAQILETIYGKTNILDRDREYSNSNIQKLVDSAERLAAIANWRINELGKSEKWDAQFQNKLLKYNNLLKLNTIFKINYDNIENSNIGLEKLKPYYSQFLKEIKVFENINCPFEKTLIYYTTKYLAKIKRIKSASIFENIKEIDTTLYKHRYLDGFIYDFLVNSQNISTIKEREVIVSSLKNILFDEKSFFISPHLNVKKIGKMVLSTPFVDIKNKKYFLSDLLKTPKKIIIIDFWASWCVPCISEFPQLKKATKKYSDKVEFISISIDEDSLKWIEACKKYKIQDNSYRNVLKMNNELVKFLELHSIPRYIILNNNGELLEDNFYRPSTKKFSMELDNILSNLKL